MSQCLSFSRCTARLWPTELTRAESAEWTLPAGCGSGSFAHNGASAACLTLVWTGQRRGAACLVEDGLRGQRGGDGAGGASLDVRRFLMAKAAARTLSPIIGGFPVGVAQKLAQLGKVRLRDTLQRPG